MKRVLRFLFVLTILLGTGALLVAVALPAGSVFATQTILELTKCTTDDDKKQCIVNYCNETSSNWDKCKAFCANHSSVCSVDAKDQLIIKLVGGQQTEVTGGHLQDCNPGGTCNPNTDLTCKDDICQYKLPSGPQSGGEILRIIKAIGDWIFAAFMLLAVIFIILALFDFISGGGDPAKISSARQKLIYAAIGVGLALVAGGIDNVLRNILLP